MSKRLIYTERPLAAPGREDVMKRVFFFPCVGRNLLLGLEVLCGLGIQGVDVASWTAAVPGPLPQPLPLFATALL